MPVDPYPDVIFDGTPAQAALLGLVLINSKTLNKKIYVIQKAKAKLPVAKGTAVVFLNGVSIGTKRPPTLQELTDG
jgi:hypothetical protein